MDMHVREVGVAPPLDRGSVRLLSRRPSRGLFEIQISGMAHSIVLPYGVLIVCWDTVRQWRSDCVLRTWMISARMEIAISSGVIAPRSRPAGALNLGSCSEVMPFCPRLARK